MPDITRDDIIHLLHRIALLLELKGENSFKIRAYRQGAESIADPSIDIIARAQADDLASIPHLGPALQTKIHEYVTTGSLAFYEELRAPYPESFFELFELSGLGPKKIATLHRELNITSVAALKTACLAGTTTALSGFGAKTTQKILEAIAFREQHADRFHAAAVAGDVDDILDYLRQHPHTSRAEVAGSFRRGLETVHDLDFVVASPQPAQLLRDLSTQTFVHHIIALGETKLSFHLATGTQCDVRAVTSDHYPFALQYFTGSKEHNVALRARALKKGWTLNEYRLENGPTDLHDEAQIYQALDLAYIPPELREGRQEFTAAAENKIPRLVELANLRGTFHNHTTASDGHHSLDEMAAAAQELGLTYLGIADHSQSSFQARGLDATRLLAQIQEIRTYNQKHPDFRLFAGSEVDILKDGTLDFPDEILAQLDYAVASVHTSFTLSSADMTRRLIRAIENPHITMLGHLTGRLLLRRDPYALDIPAILDACAATGTIIELNANPWRLDLSWTWWPLAIEKGVRCSINPDAHDTQGLHDLWSGIRSARKGWLTRDHIINTLPLGKIEPVLQAKRQRP
jgi:DNA polymerase (family X)